MKIMDNILDILSDCQTEDNILYLPDKQLDRKTYEAVNKCLENIGGKWNRKAKGHIFDTDPAELLDSLLISGETVDIRKQFQFFPTPKDIAKWMVEMSEIQPCDLLLEPSAGQGAIVDEFPKQNPYVVIELNHNNHHTLKDKGYSAELWDFLTYNPSKLFDKIVMNPPFSKQQDIDHILHAYELLKPGGILISVVSESPFFRSNHKSMDFIEFLTETNAEIIQLNEGAFKESGMKL